MSELESFLQSVKSLRPNTAIVLGSGQSQVLSELAPTCSVGFGEVPGLGVPTVAGHSGAILVGALDDIPLLIFQGRLHFYEGHAWPMVSAPIRFAAEAGITNILLTNAAGGIHPELRPGSLMILRDHLSLQRPDSWRGPAAAKSMSQAGARPSPYSQRLINLLLRAGHECGEDLISGVYASVTGPCYETPAEIRAFRCMGADAVGMSTTHEIETANQLGLECAAISAITNQAAGLGDGLLEHQDVLRTMAEIQERMGQIIRAYLRLLNSAGSTQ